MRINNRKQLYCVILAFVVLQMFLMAFNVAWGSGRVDNISLKKEGNYTQISIYGDKPFEFSHSIEGAKDGKPHRLIIDCKDMIFNLPQHDFKEGLPEGIIRGIRTSQFQVTPEKIVRVVLDLKGTAAYKVVETESERKVTIAILTTQESDFTSWAAVKDIKEEKMIDNTIEKTKIVKTETGTEKKKMPAEKVEKTAGITSTGKTTKTAATVPETQVELPTVKSSSSLIVSEKSTTETVHTDKTYKKTVSYADTGETILPQKGKPTLASQVKTPIEAKEDIRKEEKEVTAPPVQTTSLPESKTKDLVSLKHIEVQTEPSSPEVDAKSMGTHQAKEDVLSSKDLASNASTQTKSTESQPTVFTPSSTENAPKPSSPRSISRSAVPLGPYLEEKTKTGESKEKTEITVAEFEAAVKTETEKKETGATGIGSTVKKGIGAVLGTEGASAHETDSLEQTLMGIQNPLQADLGIVPSRKIITYNPVSRRDPFLPLTEKEDMQFGEVPLPQFENLKLVGIIKDKKGNQALLEDEIGFGYILRNGDKIKNGYVMGVEDIKIVFHVEEYGGYKIMTLELNPEY